MPIVSYISLFVGALINMILYLYVTKKVFNIEYTKNKKVLILSLILTALIISIINIFIKDKFKILFTFPFMVIGIKYQFSINYKKSIIYFVIDTLYIFIGEILTAIIFSMLPFDYLFLFSNVLGNIAGNLMVAIFTLPFLYIKGLSKFINKVEMTISEKAKFIITGILVLAIGALAYRNTTGISSIFNIFVNIIVIGTLIAILYMYYKENLKSQEMLENYNVLFQYLEKYENELVEKRKIIHDYKNQLIIISGYIGNKKKLSEYISELLMEQKNIAENSIIINVDKLPRGLKGLVYYKISHISKKININLQVLNNLKKFDKIPLKLSKKVLTIIGILIDNAIESVERTKQKEINIEFSINKNIFNMVMVNKCSKKINIDKIMQTGFSTKGKNRGYGLSIVKDILKQEKDIHLDMKVEDNNFISDLKVKI